MSFDNPEYKEQADKLIIAAGNIKKSIQDNGFGTMSTMVILGELMRISQVTATFTSLSPDKRDEFMAEVWDSAIGSEPNALVNKAGFLNAQALEMISDAMKAGALSYFNRALVTP